MKANQKMKNVAIFPGVLGLFLLLALPAFSESGSGTKPVISPKPATPSTSLDTQPVQSPRVEKKTASRGYYVGLGPVGLWNLNSSGIGYYLTGGYTYDLHPVAMRIGGEFLGRSGAIGFVGGLGVSYFPEIFNSNEVNPFLGFDMGYGTARVNESLNVLGQWVPAMVIGPSLGVQFFRNADVNLELALKWGFFLASGNLGSPSYSLLKLSFYFH